MSKVPLLWFPLNIFNKNKQTEVWKGELKSGSWTQTYMLLLHSPQSSGRWYQQRKRSVKKPLLFYKQITEMKNSWAIKSPLSEKEPHLQIIKYVYLSQNRSSFSSLQFDSKILPERHTNPVNAVSLNLWSQQDKKC